MDNENMGRTMPQGTEGTIGGQPDIKSAAGTVGDETKDAARTIAQTAREQGSRVTSVVKEQGTEVALQAKTALRGQAEDLKNGLAHTLDQAAVQVRSRANEMDRGDMGMRIAHPLERGADYLRQTPVEDLPQDMSRAISANPLRSVAIAFGIGLFFGGLFKRR